MWAAPGVKCVCVQGPLAKVWPGTKTAQKGETYTIRDVYLNSDGRVGIRVEEIRNPLVNNHGELVETGFFLSRFRPLVSQADDVALFAHHLQRVGEDA